MGYYNGREDQYIQARELRKIGYGYRTISKIVGINHSTIRNWVKDIECDKNTAYELSKPEQTPIEDLKSKDAVRKRLLSIRGNICESCNLDMWLDKPITLEVHHISGKGNNAENLILLCPNCHSYTDNWRKQNGRVKEIGKPV